MFDYLLTIPWCRLRSADAHAWIFIHTHNLSHTCARGVLAPTNYKRMYVLSKSRAMCVNIVEVKNKINKKSTLVPPEEGEGTCVNLFGLEQTLKRSVH